MTTPSWSTMWMQTTASQWRVICSRGPATPLRRGIGMKVKTLLMNTFTITFYDMVLFHYSELIGYLGGRSLSSTFIIAILNLL